MQNETNRREKSKLPSEPQPLCKQMKLLDNEQNPQFPDTRITTDEWKVADNMPKMAPSVQTEEMMLLISNPQLLNNSRISAKWM